MHRLLLIEDDARLAGMVADYLGQAGFVVDRAPTVAQPAWRWCANRLTWCSWM